MEYKRTATNILLIVSAIVILSLSRLTGESCRKKCIYFSIAIKNTNHFLTDRLLKSIYPLKIINVPVPIVFF